MKRLILLYVSIMTMGCYAQYVPQLPSRNFGIVPKSPAVYQFLKYDELPVSEYTGIPDISVPLYNISQDGIEFPLNLVYHAGGIKVNQDATWIGLGWDMPLPNIVQVINGLDDFYEDPDLDPKDSRFPNSYKRRYPDCFYTSISTNYGYERFPVEINNTLLHSLPSTTHISLVNQDPQLLYSYFIATGYRYSTVGAGVQDSELFTGQIDTEPDIFKVNIFGETLNIVLNFRGEGSTKDIFFVLNKRGYQVSRSNKTWTIINPHGQQFIFQDYTVSKGSVNSSWGGGVADAKFSRTWVLNKIITEKGKEIVFTYNKTANEISSVTLTQSAEMLLSGITRNKLTSTQTSSGTNSSYPTDRLITTTTICKEHQFYLKSVTFPKGRVEFSLTERTDIAGTKRLSKMEVYNLNGQLIKKDEFNHDYFIEKGSGKRLKLLSVKENDQAMYSFSYNDTQLPAKNSFEQDYWGYCNGKSSNTSLIPNPKRFKTYAIDNNNNMSANLEYTKSAILESIKYPTGGTVRFDYELNRFDNYWVPDINSSTNTVSNGLGLRVKSIIYKDHTGNIIKEVGYSYDAGKANLKLLIFFKSNRSNYDFDYEYFAEMLNVSVNGFYGSNPLSPFTGVGYGKVTKVLAGTENGRIESYYHNTSGHIPKQTELGTNIVTLLSLPSFKNIEYPANGKLKSVRYYDSYNILKKEEIYEYKNVVSPIYRGSKISGYAAHFVKYYDTGANAMKSYNTLQHVVAHYPIVDYESLLADKTIREYTLTDTLEYKEGHGYDSYGQISSKRIDKIFSNHSHNWNYKYPRDFPNDQICRGMVAKNILSPVIEENEINYKGNTINLKQTKYKIQDNIYLPDCIQIKQKYFDNFMTDIVFNLYDTKGNIREYTSLDGTGTVYLWSYNYQYPIAEIKNATYLQVSRILTQALIDRVAGAAEPSASDMAAINNLRPNTSLNALVSTYTYKPLVGILTATDPSGTTTYYEYDTFGRLKRTKDVDGRTIQEYDYHYQNQ